MVCFHFILFLSPLDSGVSRRGRLTIRQSEARTTLSIDYHFDRVPTDGSKSLREGGILPLLKPSSYSSSSSASEGVDLKHKNGILKKLEQKVLDTATTTKYATSIFSLLCASVPVCVCVRACVPGGFVCRLVFI